MIEGVVVVTRQPDGGLTWRWDPEDADVSLVSRVALEQLLEDSSVCGRLKEFWKSL